MQPKLLFVLVALAMASPTLSLPSPTASLESFSILQRRMNLGEASSSSAGRSVLSKVGDALGIHRKPKPAQGPVNLLHIGEDWQEGLLASNSEHMPLFDNYPMPSMSIDEAMAFKKLKRQDPTEQYRSRLHQNLIGVSNSRLAGVKMHLDFLDHNLKHAPPDHPKRDFWERERIAAQGLRVQHQNTLEVHTRAKEFEERLEARRHRA